MFTRSKSKLDFRDEFRISSDIFRMENIAGIVKKVQAERETKCYINSATFLKLFPSPQFERKFNHYSEFKAWIYSVLSYSVIYNIELHISMQGLNKAELTKGLVISGLTAHMTKNREIRALTHAFNLVITPERIKHFQSWFRIQDYHEIYDDSNPVWFMEKLGHLLHGYIENPWRFFRFFGVKKHDLCDSCHIKSLETLFQRLAEAKRQRNCTIKLEIIAQRKYLF